MMNINIISGIRKKFSITQEELAHLLNVSFSSVNAWESGRRSIKGSMQERLVSLIKSETISEYNDTCHVISGFNKTGAGYVSSVIGYGKQRDDQPFTHGIGRWYGSLPSFLVRDVINFIFDDHVFPGISVANFCGSGTIPLEMALAGRKCFAIDANPVAVLLTLAKTNLLDLPPINDIELLLKDVADNIHIDNIDANANTSNLLINDNQWIPAKIQHYFKRIISGINSITNTPAQILIATALLSVSVDFCCVDKRCTNHYVYKYNTVFTFNDIILALEKETLKYVDMIMQLKEKSDYVSPIVRWGDACNLPLEDGVASFVFSHPPYGTTINYYSITRIQQSLLELIQWNDNMFEEKDLLSKCQGWDISSGTLNRYNQFNIKWLKEAYRVLNKNGLLVVVIGDSRDAGKLSHPFTHIIDEGEKLGFITKEIFIWITNHKAGMHVKRKSHHIDHNYVIIMEKEYNGKNNANQSGH